MDEDQLYVATPPHKPPRRIPADTIAVEWLTERLEQIPDAERDVPGSVARGDDRRLPRAVSRVDLPLGARPYRLSVPLTHHVDVPATARRTYQPLAPLRDRGLGAVSPRLLGGIRLDPVAARLATTR